LDKLIYRFNNQGSNITINSKEILGGKGANLAQMAKLDLPVPAGFTISTKVCDYFYKNDVTIYPGKGAKKDTFRIANIGAIDYKDMKVFNKLMLQYFQEKGII